MILQACNEHLHDCVKESMGAWHLNRNARVRCDDAEKDNFR